jgi:hypothetical protein
MNVLEMNDPLAVAPQQVIEPQKAQIVEVESAHRIGASNLT